MQTNNSQQFTRTSRPEPRKLPAQIGMLRRLHELRLDHVLTAVQQDLRISRRLHETGDLHLLPGLQHGLREQRVPARLLEPVRQR